MQPSTLLLALAASASAASIIPRQLEEAMNITYLSIDSVYQRQGVSYDLKVNYNGASATCTVSQEEPAGTNEHCASSAPKAWPINGFGPTQCGDDPAWTWSLTPVPSINAYGLAINYTRSDGPVSGCKTLSYADFACSTDPNAGDEETYTGLSSFMTSTERPNTCIY